VIFFAFPDRVLDASRPAVCRTTHLTEFRLFSLAEGIAAFRSAVGDQGHLEECWVNTVMAVVSGFISISTGGQRTIRPDSGSPPFHPFASLRTGLSPYSLMTALGEA
jgi:hypothetical protein